MEDAEGVDVLSKFEREQSFSEPDAPRWVVWERGDHDEATRLIEEEMRTAIYEEVQNAFYQAERIRVVEEPLTNYVEWQLLVLRHRAEAGENSGVLTSGS